MNYDFENQYPDVLTNNASVLSAQAYETSKNVLGAVFIIILSSLTVAYVLWSSVSHSILYLWIGLVWGAALIRVINLLCYKKDSKPNERSRYWCLRFTITSSLSAIAWSSSAFLIFPEQDFTGEVYLVMLTCGIAGSSVSVQSYIRSAINIYIVALLLPFIFRYSFLQTEIHFKIEIIIFIYLVVMIFIANKTHKYLLKQMALIIENTDLIEELALSKVRYQLMLDSMSDMYFMTDMHGKIIKVNNCVAEKLGYAIHETIDMRLGDIDVAVSKKVIEWNNTASKTESSEKISSTFKCKDSECISVNVTVKPVTLKNKIYFIIHAQDITEQKKVQNELQIKTSQVQFIIDCSDIIVWAVDNEGIFIFSEGKGLEILGLKSGELVGLSLYELYADELDIVSQVKHALSGEQSSLRSVVKGHTFETRYAPIIDNDNTIIGCTGVVIDITEQLIGEEKLVKASELAVKANNIQSEFLSQMSHELRTPLNAIYGFSQLLKMKNDLDELEMSYVDEIFEAGEYLLTLINNILNLSNINSRKINVNIVAVDLNTVIMDSLSVISNLASENNISLEYTQYDDVEVAAGYTELRQVLINLLSNAIKYNKENGNVKISYSILKEGYVKISVTDTGVGVSDENMAKVFMPFERLGAEFTNIKGSGIGLVIAKSLIELMGGEITIESKVNKGSTFNIVLCTDVHEVSVHPTSISWGELKLI